MGSVRAAVPIKRWMGRLPDSIPAGQKMAREQLDAAWPKYPEAMSQIRLGAAALASPQERLTKVAEYSPFRGSIRIRLIEMPPTILLVRTDIQAASVSGP
jgi:hypothetical protein